MSNDDKLLLAQGGATIKCQIIVKATSELPEIILTERDAIKDWEYTDERYVPKQGFIGQFVARTLSGNLQNINDDFNIDGREIELKIGITSNDNTNWYSLGNFIITDPTDNDVTDNTKFEAMDYTKLFNKRFDGDFTNNNFPESYNEIINNKRGVTTLWLVEYCCEQVGVEFGQTTFTNDDFIISQNPFQAGETCRDVLKEISKLAYSWVRIGWDNKCYIDFEQVDDVIAEENIITNNHYYTLETHKELYGPINNVVIGMSGVDGESHSIKDNSSIEQYGEHTIYIYDNPLTNTFELRALAQQRAYKLFGLTYAQVNVETIGHPWLQANEKINVLNMESVSNITYPFNRTIKFSGHIRTTIDSITGSEIEATLAYESDILKNIRNASLNVDKANGRIDALVKNVESNNKTISEKINQLEITDSNTTSKIINIEKTLETTNSDIGELSEKVNGYTADFNEFYDNEYIKSIDNLQKQIDGSIQFWNGAEIPTLSNKPAVDWKTEDERVNHQADIYTVIIDVDGELKQGKSYRFDKVNGTWQWIELTDNELSAVQAIAQEALNKANTNLGDITTIKSKVSTLEQTDEQITAGIETLDSQVNPTATKEGSHIHIDDAAEYPLIQFEIEGESEQETRSGKNILKSVNTTVRETFGITFTPNADGSITINGTATDNAYFTVNGNYSDGSKHVYFTLEKGQTYTSYLGNNNVSGVRMATRTETQNLPFLNTGYGSELGVNTYTGETDTQAYAFVEVRSGTTLNNFTVYPMILKGEYTLDTIGEFEKYGVSPSPDYPSEIESVGYENLWDEQWELGTIDANTGSMVSTSVRIRSKNYINVYENTTYRMVRPDEAQNILIVFFDSNKSYIKSVYTYQDNDIFTTPINCTYMLISPDSTYGVTYNNNIAIIKGKQQRKYIPHGKHAVDITTTGENLFDEDKYFSMLTNDNGVYTGKSSLPYASYSKSRGGLGLTFKSNTSYAISFNAKNTSSGTNTFAIGIVYDDDTIEQLQVIGSAWKTYKIVTGVSKSISMIYFTYYNNEEFSIKNFMINEGQTYKTYQKYIGSETTILLNKPLRSLPNGVKDIAYIKNNKLYADRYVGSVVLDGSETWNVHSSTTTRTVFYTTLSEEMEAYTLAGVVPNLKSSHFIPVTNAKTWTNGDISRSVGTNYIFLTMVTGYTVDTFKNWLSTHNTQVDYVLAEPYTEEIGEVDVPRTLQGINNITTTDNLSPMMSIEYARNTPLSNYVEEHVSELKITNKEIKESVKSVEQFAVSLDSEVDSRLQDIGKNFDNYVPQSTFVTLEKSVKQIQTDTYTKTEINTKLTDGSVTKVSTISGTFDEDGMHYEKTNAPTSSTINEVGVRVDSTTNGAELLFAGYDEELKQTIVRTENLTVRKYFIVGDNSRIENYGNGGGIFII